MQEDCVLVRRAVMMGHPNSIAVGTEQRIPLELDVAETAEEENVAEVLDYASHCQCRWNQRRDAIIHGDLVELREFHCFKGICTKLIHGLLLLSGPIQFVFGEGRGCLGGELTRVVLVWL